MKFKKLYSFCASLIACSRICIKEEGRDTVNAILKDVYYDICEREIKWFSFEDGLFVVKLKRKE